MQKWLTEDEAFRLPGMNEETLASVKNGNGKLFGGNVFLAFTPNNPHPGKKFTLIGDNADINALLSKMREAIFDRRGIRFEALL